jgi:PAS domain-containing protein
MLGTHKLSDEQLALLRLRQAFPMELDPTSLRSRGNGDALRGAQQAVPAAAEKQGDLRIVNEKLEKAIEQLRLTSQALQATNQELCSLNDELEMMNEEVEILSNEVSRLRKGYAHPLDQAPYRVMLVDTEGKIRVWNAAAQQLSNIAPDARVGIDLSEISGPTVPGAGAQQETSCSGVIWHPSDAERPTGAGEPGDPPDGPGKEKAQGLKPNSLSALYGPTKVRP